MSTQNNQFLYQMQQPPLENPNLDSPKNEEKKDSEPSYDFIFKVVLIGDSNSGKTSLINRFVNKVFEEKYLTTIGVDFFMKEIEIEGKAIKLQIWDTAGMEKYRSISTSYYRGSHAAFVLFDITSKATFENVHKWIEAYYKSSNPNFKKNVVLIGNKIDLEEQREVNKEDAENYAKDNDMIYWETSAKEGNNVEEVFQYIAKYLYDNFKGEFTQSAMSNSLLKDNDKGSYSDMTGKCC